MVPGVGRGRRSLHLATSRTNPTTASSIRCLLLLVMVHAVVLELVLDIIMSSP